jgi:hypothetical protein
MLLLIKDLVAGSKMGGCGELAQLGVYLSVGAVAVGDKRAVELTWK